MNSSQGPWTVVFHTHYCSPSFTAPDDRYKKKNIVVHFVSAANKKGQQPSDSNRAPVLPEPASVVQTDLMQLRRQLPVRLAELLQRLYSELHLRTCAGTNAQAAARHSTAQGSPGGGHTHTRLSGFVGNVEKRTHTHDTTLDVVPTLEVHWT